MIVASESASRGRIRSSVSPAATHPTGMGLAGTILGMVSVSGRMLGWFDRLLASAMGVEEPAPES